jgi:hypothetical protein
MTSATPVLLMLEKRSSEECLLQLLCFHIPCCQQMVITGMSTATNCVDGNHVVVTAVCPAADGLFYQSAGPGTLLGGACLFLENALMLEKRSSEEGQLQHLCFHVPCFQPWFIT